jgi:uncharacterized cupin superfamily protein
VATPSNRISSLQVTQTIACAYRVWHAAPRRIRRHRACGVHAKALHGHDAVCPRREFHIPPLCGVERASDNRIRHGRALPDRARSRGIVPAHKLPPSPTEIAENAMPKIDLTTIPERTGSGYPAPFAQSVGARGKQALGDAGGLSDFGVNLTRLPPGAWSSQRHWHTAEDELVYVLSGEVTLVTDAGEQILRAQDCAAFARGVPDGHHLINRGTETAVYLEIGSRRDDDTCHYPDIDLHFDGAIGHYTHKDGVPYPVAGE